MYWIYKLVKFNKGGGRPLFKYFFCHGYMAIIMRNIGEEEVKW